ncbi:hypothetical protein HK097_001466 [Rhizophlyctis rosea]|uniref:Uncharacterized protein n=1 Tax=Rhizophlyctis rosea TaxID=64517 RepID=A0AAD5X1B0_9FUNG|nr:hypothetical protein HK097_001466 [Rhizophlyctis rosea]
MSLSFSSPPPPPLPSEILLEIAKLTDPTTVRTLLRTTKPFSKLISPKLISHVDASWYYIYNSEKASWIWAAKHGHIHIIQKLLRRKCGTRSDGEVMICEPLQLYRDGALLIAAGRGYIDIVRILLDAGAHMESTDFLAGLKEYPSSISRPLGLKRKEILIEMGVETFVISLAHFRDWLQGHCALRRAALKGHSEVLQLFLEAGAYFRCGNDWLLWTAAKLGRTTVVRVLLEAGADVHSLEDEALRNAAAAGHVETVLALLEAGADIHSQDDEALQVAAWAGHVETVLALLKAGAKVQCSADVALKIGAAVGHVETVSALLEAGADLSANNYNAYHGA